MLWFLAQVNGEESNLASPVLTGCSTFELRSRIHLVENLLLAPDESGFPVVHLGNLFIARRQRAKGTDAEGFRLIFSEFGNGVWQAPLPRVTASCQGPVPPPVLNKGWCFRLDPPETQKAELPFGSPAFVHSKSPLSLHAGPPRATVILINDGGFRGGWLLMGHKGSHPPLGFHRRALTLYCSYEQHEHVPPRTARHHQSKPVSEPKSRTFSGGSRVPPSKPFYPEPSLAKPDCLRLGPGRISRS